MAARIVGNAAFSHQEDAGEFGAQFFLCIFNVAESPTVIECLPVEALRCAGPVRRFMERRPIMARCNKAKAYAKVASRTWILL